MIDIKRATQSALSAFQEIYAREDYQRIHVEEVERSEDGSTWNVLIGYDFMPTGSLGLDLLERHFKRVRLDAESGDVLAIKSVSNRSNQ